MKLNLTLIQANIGKKLVTVVGRKVCALLDKVLMFLKLIFAALAGDIYGGARLISMAGAGGPGQYGNTGTVEMHTPTIGRSSGLGRRDTQEQRDTRVVFPTARVLTRMKPMPCGLPYPRQSSMHPSLPSFRFRACILDSSLFLFLETKIRP